VINGLTGPDIDFIYPALLFVQKNNHLKFFIIRRSKSGQFMPRSAIIFILFGITGLLIACNAALTNKSTCVSCHQGLEAVSATHPVCIDCHGGDSKSEDKMLLTKACTARKIRRTQNSGIKPAESVIPINSNGCGPISCSPTPV